MLDEIDTMQNNREYFNKLHKSMFNTYFKYEPVLKPLHDFYCKQFNKDISLPSNNDRFYLREFQQFIKDFWITNILMMVDDQENKAKWKKSNKEQRVKQNIKKQTLTPIQETDNIYRQLVKGKPRIDNIKHGMQYEEFKMSLLRIVLLAEK